MSAGPRPPNADPVARERALDPRTGLPVVRYVGPYPPTLGPGAPAPVGAWRVLASEARDGRWFVELETAASARPLAEVAASVDDGDVEELLEMLEDAARLGVAHGGLTIDRLWRHGPSVRVEGYGVGWAAEASVDADRATIARALLDLPGTAITPPVRAHLEELARRTEITASPRPTTPTPALGDAPPTPPTPPTPPSVAATFVKGPPPGARVRPGDTPTAPLHERAARAVARAQASAEGRRRLALGVVLVVAVVVLASLSVALQRRPQPVAAVAGSAVAFVVDVRIEPAGLPPARLVVLESPPGSRLVAGTVIGSVPRRVPLDRAGTWRFEARFLDRRSEAATLVLPGDHALVLVFPDPTTAAP